MFSFHFIPFSRKVKQNKTLLDKCRPCRKLFTAAILVLGSVFHGLRFMGKRQHFGLIYFTYLFRLLFFSILGGHMESLCGKLQL